jgi:hypothetical protein
MTSVATFLLIVAATSVAGACAIAQQVLATETQGWMIELSRRLVRRAVRRLPRSHQDRYEDEWLAELATLEGRPITSLAYALHVFSQARRTGSEISDSADALSERRERPTESSRVWRSDEFAARLVALIVERSQTNGLSWRDVLGSMRRGIGDLDGETEQALAGANSRFSTMLNDARWHDSDRNHHRRIQQLRSSSESVGRTAALPPMLGQSDLVDLWSRSSSDPRARKDMRIRLGQLIDQQLEQRATGWPHAEPLCRRAAGRAVTEALLEWSERPSGDLETHIRAHIGWAIRDAQRGLTHPWTISLKACYSLPGITPMRGQQRRLVGLLAYIVAVGAVMDLEWGWGLLARDGLVPYVTHPTLWIASVLCSVLALASTWKIVAAFDHLKRAKRHRAIELLGVCAVAFAATVALILL